MAYMANYNLRVTYLYKFPVESWMWKTTGVRNRNKLIKKTGIIKSVRRRLEYSEVYVEHLRKKNWCTEKNS